MLERKQTYNEFIASIRESRENIWFKNSERHHIVPRSLGGSDEDENLIYLTYREHFIAHRLLVEENPTNSKLIYAWHLMCVDGRHNTTPEEYEEVKLAYSAMKSESMRGNTISKGIKHTETARKHMSAGKIGNTNRRGYKEPPEVRARMSKAQTGIKRPMSEEGRKHIALAHPRGEKHPNYGMTHSLETRQRMSEAARGENNGFYGKHHTEESLQRIRAASSRTDYDRVCKICGSHFLGGTSAKYCKSCKAKR